MKKQKNRVDCHHQWVGWGLMIVSLSSLPNCLFSSQHSAIHLFNELSSAAFCLDAKRFSMLWHLVSNYQSYTEESKKLFISTLLAIGDQKARLEILEKLFTNASHLTEASWDRTTFFKTYPFFATPAGDASKTISSLEVALFSPRTTTKSMESLFGKSSHFKDRNTVITILNRIIYEERELSIRKHSNSLTFPTLTPLEQKIFWFIHKNPFHRNTALLVIQSCLKTNSNSLYMQKTVLWKESFLSLCLAETIISSARKLVREQLFRVLEDSNNPAYRFFISSTKPAKLYYFIRGILELYNSFFGTASLFNLNTKILLNPTKQNARLLIKATQNLDQLTQLPNVHSCPGTYFKTPFELWNRCCLLVSEDHYARKQWEEFHASNWCISPFSTKRQKMDLKDRLGFIKSQYERKFEDIAFKFYEK